ncbi:T9SS type A sorting domain-containing protein [Winogradskyella vidalii]|uniref:T9SS type A sorting domain-containing protein n=1 Tax=Winogradskyella vidalii TaxID=2615024 RepID=UPI0015C6C0C8|nr:T9SS type A sorting domain-containing protein [Winogradskyella vidalii]
MRKITFIFTLLTCALGYSQTTLGYYTEATVTETVATQNLNGDGITINTSFSDAGTDGGSTVIEAVANSGGAENYQGYFNYPGSPNQDLSSYSFYHFSMKSSSPQPTIIRFEDAGGQQANFDPTSYGFAYDGNWHTMVIPFTDISTQNASFNFTDVNNVFFIKSTPGDAGSVVPETYIFYIDHVYFSTSNDVLSTETFELSKITMFPNPANTEISISSKNSMDTIKFYNVLGKEVLVVNPKSNNSIIDISNLKSGIYIVKLTADGKTTSTKLIKE